MGHVYEFYFVLFFLNDLEKIKNIKKKIIY